MPESGLKAALMPKLEPCGPWYCRDQSEAPVAASTARTRNSSGEPLKLRPVTKTLVPSGLTAIDAGDIWAGVWLQRGAPVAASYAARRPWARTNTVEPSGDTMTWEALAVAGLAVQRTVPVAALRATRSGPVVLRTELAT